MFSFNAFSNAGQVLTVGNLVEFEVNDVTTCSGVITHTAGSSSFALNAPGRYLILANVNLSSTAAGANTLLLYNNGSAINGTEMTVTAAAADDDSNFAISKIITVAPSCPVINNTAHITVGLSAGGGTIVDANMAIVKVA